MRRVNQPICHFKKAAKGDVAVFSEAAIQSLRSLLPAQSKEAVMDVLGISANTWVKIKRGDPIRASTAKWLVMRVGMDGKDRSS